MKDKILNKINTAIHVQIVPKNISTELIMNQSKYALGF